MKAHFPCYTVIKPCNLRIILFFLLCSSTSCISVYREVNNIGKANEIADRERYVEFFNHKYDYDPNKIFFPDKEQFADFAMNIVENKVDYFYGIMVNDSLKINDPFLNDNTSCAGRITSIIESTDQKYPTVKSGLGSFNFSNIYKENINWNKGKSVVFIISTQLGNGRNKIIKELTEKVEAVQNDQIDYYLISMDNL